MMLHPICTLLSWQHIACGLQVGSLDTSGPVTEIKLFCIAELETIQRRYTKEHTFGKILGLLGYFDGTETPLPGEEKLALCIVIHMEDDGELGSKF